MRRVTKPYRPPFTISDRTIQLLSDIMELVTELTLRDVNGISPRLRREGRIRTIQASLAIENNSLSVDQVSAVIQGRRVLGPAQDIQEVKNAYEAYESLLELDPYAYESLLAAHRILMRDLTTEAGCFRSGGVGVCEGPQLIHMAPPADLVPGHIRDLLHWVEHAETHPLIKSCVFHYEFEFIHPFIDGNGRMGRMWQTLILYRWKRLFGWVPVETRIKERQDAYYRVLGECDRNADSGLFIEFMLQAFHDSLAELAGTEQVTVQVKRLLSVMEDAPLSTKELMGRVGITHRPTFRDNYLLPAIRLGFVEMTVPEKPNSSRQRYRRVKY